MVGTWQLQNAGGVALRLVSRNDAANRWPSAHLRLQFYSCGRNTDSAARTRNIHLLSLVLVGTEFASEMHQPVTGRRKAKLTGGKPAASVGKTCWKSRRGEEQMAKRKRQPREDAKLASEATQPVAGTQKLLTATEPEITFSAAAFDEFENILEAQLDALVNRWVHLAAPNASSIRRAVPQQRRRTSEQA